MLAHKSYDDCPYQETRIPFILSLVRWTICRSNCML